MSVEGCTRSDQPRPDSPAETVQEQTSALTVLPRTGWTALASVWTTDGWKAFDSNTTTSWTTEANALNNQFFQVDMLVPQTFAELTLDSGGATNDYPRGFEVRVSNDGSSWTAVATGTGTSALVTVTFPLQTARYVKVVLTAGFNSWWSIAELKVLGPVLSRTGWTASGTANPGSDTPAMALDGTASTRWSTSADQAPGQFFQVDMQTKQDFNQVTLDAGASTGKYPRGYEVYVSNDGSTWGSPVATGSGTTAFISIGFPWQWARYVKVVQTATSAGNVWAIHEFNVYGQPTALSTLSQAPWSATTNPTGQGAAANAFDGNQGGSTRWSTNTAQVNGQWFRVDLGAARSFSQLTLDANPATTDYPRSYEVYVSNDGSTWGSPVSTGTGSTALVTASFAPQSARYVRVNQIGAASASWSIYELNVLGTALARTGWIVTATAASGSDTAGKALDNNTTTRWTASANQANGQFFQVDMVTPHVFNELSLDAGPGANAARYPRNFEVRVSNDGTTWGSPVATGAGTSGLTTIKFLTQTARFIKVTQTGTATVPWSIYELNVWRGYQACDAGCTASDTCHDVGTCDPYTGACTNPQKTNGTACNDANACTTGETCSAGVCGGGSAVTCTGADQCNTVGACLPATGCPAPVAKANGTTCTDANACTQTDTCQAGACTGANPVTCTASDQCHAVGACNTSTGACSNPPKTNGAMCNDGNVATQSETCQAGTCTAPTFPLIQNLPVQELTTGGLSGVAFIDVRDINLAGQIVGAGSIGGVRQALQWNASTPTQMNNVGALPGFAADSSLTAISPSGTAVGFSNINPSLPLYRAFRYSPATGVQYFDFGDNAAGWNSGGYFDYGAKAMAINAAGQMGGYYTKQGETRGFRYTDGGGLEDVGTLAGRMTFIFGIDDGGRAVGSSWVPTAGTFDVERLGHAVMFDNAVTGLVDLNTLVDTMLGWTLYTAYDINGNWVVGTGLHAGKVVGFRLNLATGVIDEMWPGWGGRVYANKVTSWGAVLGTGYLTAEYGQPSSFIYTDQLGYKILNDLIDPAGNWSLSSATSSNENLDVVGVGVHNGVNTPFVLRNVVPAALFCQGRATGTPCSDGDACTTGETCSAGVCGGGSAVTCTGADQCNTVAACVPATGCPAPVQKANGAVCNDGNACTQTDTCQAGACAGGNLVTCTASDQCHGVGTCNSATGACSNPTRTDGTACDDGSAATQSETCQAGACQANPNYPVITNLQVDDIGNLGGSYANPSGINKNGTVAGSGPNAANQGHAWVWNYPGPIVDLGNDPGFGGFSSGANGINESGMITGSTGGSSPTGSHLYRYSPITGLEHLGGGDGTTFQDCIEAGLCATLSGATGYAINASGQMAGQRVLGGAYTGFRYTDGIGFENIGTLAGGRTYAASIADDGTVTGSSWVPGTVDYSVDVRRYGHAVRFSGPLVELEDLNDTYVDPMSDWILRSARLSANGRYIAAVADRGDGLLHGCRIDTTTGDLREIGGGWGGDTYVSGVNGNGDVVGYAFVHAGDPQPHAFLYTDKIGIKKLDDLIDPASGWQLNWGFAINEYGDVVGRGWKNNAWHAFRLRAIVPTQIACDDRPDGAECDDHDACTRLDTCHSGTCAGTTVTCVASDDCHDTGTCNSSTGVCSNPTKTDGTSCNDGMACTTGETCHAGACRGGQAASSCPQPGPCQAIGWTCDESNCPRYVAAADGTACNDGNACTQTDACHAGTCTGSNAVTCTASDLCHMAGACNPTTGTCSNPAQPDGTACNDADSCSSGDSCVAGACQGATFDEGCTGSNGYLRPQFLQPKTGYELSDALDINNAGTLVGYSSAYYGAPRPAGQAAEPFFATRGGAPTQLPNPWPNGGEAYAYSINEQGYIAGTGGPNNTVYNTDYNRPVLYHPDHTFELPSVPQVSSFSVTDTYGATTGLPDLVGATQAYAPGAIGAWHLDGDAQDVVGFTSLPAPGAGSFVTGRYGQAVAFDGSTCLHATATANTTVGGASGVTMMAWVKPDPAICSGDAKIVFQRGWDFTLALTCNSAGHAALTHLLSGPESGFAAPVGDLPFGEWSHVAVSWDHRQLRSYINGAVAATQPLVGTQLANSATWVSIGCWPQMATANFTGAIDEVAVFRQPMATDQVARYMNNHGDYRGEAFFGGYWQWSRYTDGFFDLIAPPAGALYEGVSGRLFGQSPQGILFGSHYLSSNEWTGVTYTGAGGMQRANDLLPSGSNWDIARVGGINAAGVAVGDGRHNGTRAVFKLDLAAHTITDLGPFPHPPYNNPLYNIHANDVNATGHVVGTVLDDYDNGTLRAFVYTAERGLVDLNDFVDPASGWTLVTATAINDSDEVVGSAVHNGDQHTRRGFRLKLPFVQQAECVGKAEGAVCDPHNLCMQSGSCHTGTCQGTPVGDGAWCDDNDACTLASSCQAGACRGATPVSCYAADSCHSIGACNPTTGFCSTPSIPGSSCQVGSAGVWMFEPPAGKQCSQGTGINNAGEIVGYSDALSDPAWPAAQPAAPFVTVNGLERALPIPQGASSLFGAAISPTGYVVGNGPDAQTGKGAVYLYRPEDLGSPERLPFTADGAKAFAARTTYSGIGSLPSVVGEASSGLFGNPWQWASYDVPAPGETAQPTSIPAPFGFFGEGAALAVNQFGEMAGYYTTSEGAHRAMVWTDWGGIQDLTALVQGTEWILETATGINAAGDVIGWGWMGSLRRSFRLNINTNVITDLDVVDMEHEGLAHNATAINSNGHIVGTIGASMDETGEHLDPELAFIYTEKSRLVDLNTYVQMPPGWILASATGINDSDEVTGIALNTSTRERRAYKAKVPALPSPAELACVGKVDGQACGPGRFCLEHNVCYQGTCGGADPADALCLRARGAVDIGGNKAAAIFSFENKSGDRILPGVNKVSIDGAVVPLPDPSPPQWLEPGTKTDGYIGKFPIGSTHSITWRVNGQEVTQAGTTDLIRDPEKGGVVVHLDGEDIPVVPDLSSYAAKPALQKAVDSAPPVGEEFKGTLEGKLTVGPSGAAVYTLPISIPPGVAGMAPSLSLVYNSQAGAGLGGEGWSLTGLSMIHQCPKTRLDDGIADPLTATSLLQGKNVCIDGKRLFENDGPGQAGTYFLGVKDFSSIKKVGDTFVVTTKSGETRFYGLNPKSLVRTPRIANIVTPQTVMWPLDRVIDQWGNYFDVTYNDDVADFNQRGLIPTQIRYTGHLPTDQKPFHTITFQYSSADRKVARIMRFGPFTVPVKKLLTGITTPVGVYTLRYIDETTRPVLDKLTLPDQLEGIKYCATGSFTPGKPAPCLPELTFGWTGGGFTSMEHSTDAYKLPAPLDPYSNANDRTGDRGTRFIDLDGDGLLDVVRARWKLGSWYDEYVSREVGYLVTEAWRNTGAGFESKPAWRLPNNLVDGDGQAGGSALADMDGDGRLDYVTHYYSANFPPSWGNTLHIPPTEPGGSETIIPNPSVVVYLNRIGPTCQGTECWQLSALSKVTPWVWTGGNICGDQYAVATNDRVNLLPNGPYTDSLADMNGDGRADLVRIAHHQVGCGRPSEMYVAINNGTSWQADPSYSFRGGGFRSSNPEDYHLEDINRDGLADLVNHQIDSNSNVYVGVNSGSPTGTVWQPHDTQADPNWRASSQARSVGDVSGDGYYDPMSFFEISGQIGSGGRETGLGRGAAITFSVARWPSLTFGTGDGYTTAGVQSFLDAISRFGPDPAVSRNIAIDQVSNYVAGMADLNGDGLADLLLNHSNGAQLLFNTGTTWADVNGATSRQAQAGLIKAKFVPSAYSAPSVGYVTPKGATFADINGDGVVDLLLAQDGGHDAQDGTTGPTVGATYLNTFAKPRIEHFPAGLARRTDVTYAVITTKDARDGDEPVYRDPMPIAAGTTAAMLPIPVVSTVAAQDGRGFGPPAMTRYQYESFRGSALGHGPQGFRKVIVTEPSDDPDPISGPGTAGTRTETTYAQVYPYTGMPILVTKSKAGLTLSETTTKYCDHLSGGSTPPSCPGADGPGIEYPARSELQVYPREITDTSFPIGGVAGEGVQTHSTFTYDGFGNALLLEVEMKHVLHDPVTGADTVTESHSSKTQSWFGQLGSGPEAEQGKPTWTEVTTQRTDGTHAAIVHKTAFDYANEGGFQVAVPGGGAVGGTRLALKKKRVEPGSWSLLNQVEVHTAFGYDAFGNVTTTTSCASDFTSCDAGATNPSTEDSRNHPAFRTTKVSYDPGDFNRPSGAGTALASATGYAQKGRFPVRTENAAGHVEYTLYHALTGQLRQRTGPNGIHTCYRYDEFGTQTAEITRCGTDYPLETTTRRYEALGFGGESIPVVTVTQAPGASPTWTYSDVFGRVSSSITYGFDGRLVQTERTTWDKLGRVSTTSKPRTYYGGAAYLTAHKYDVYGPESLTIQDLGQLGAPGDVGTSKTTRVFYGMSVMTYQNVTVEDPQTHVRTPALKQRLETKNTLGKVAEVRVVGSSEDGTESTTTYSYDADGNLTDTFDPSGNNVHITYDAVGRKISTNDPDLGTWTYTYDGFGDLLEQKDAKQDVTSMFYDVLGRMTSKTAGGFSSYWIYDRAEHGLGKLSAMVGPPDPNLNGNCAIETAEDVTALDANRSGRWFHYSALGDIAETFECVDGSTFSTQVDYDPATGRQIAVHYPAIDGNRLVVGYNYSPLGYLQFLTEEPSGSVLWAATAENAAGQVTAEKTRNGIDSTFERNPSTGWLLGSSSTSHVENDKLLQRWEYRFDEVGNLRSRRRSDAVNGVPTKESFGYDMVDRLRKARVEFEDGGPSPSETLDTFTYDVLGNLTWKNEKTYGYTGCAGPHAVCSVGTDTSYEYDPNGGMTSGAGRTVTYGPNHKPSHIVSASDQASVDFVYGADDARTLQLAISTGSGGTVESRTTYVGLGATGKSLYERRTDHRTSGDTVEHTQFIYAGSAHGGSAFAVRVITSAGGTSSEPQLKYFHTDHLGSVMAISNDAGHVIDSPTAGPDATVMGYDAWGARRLPGGLPADPAYFHPQVGHREFTGHEAIPGVGLVNMNGRVYDPVLGRFLSPDPTVQFVANLQSFNRYSYVLNNPVSYTDPTGYRAVISQDVDSYVGAGVTVAGMIACAGPQGAACYAATVAGMVWSASTMRAAGAGWGDVIAFEGMSFVASYFTGKAIGSALKGTAAAPMAGLISGAVSGAESGALSTAVFGGELGENMLMGAAEGLRSAATSMVVGEIVSEASAELAASLLARRLYAEAPAELTYEEGPLPAIDPRVFKYVSGEDYRLTDGAVKSFSPLLQKYGTNLSDVTVSFNNAAQKSETHGNHITFGQDFLDGGRATKLHTFSHELAHVAQYHVLGLLRVNLRRLSECLLVDCYQVKPLLQTKSLEGLNVTSGRFAIEAMANQFADQVVKTGKHQIFNYYDLYK